jgi:hypothetical protein
VRILARRVTDGVVKGAVAKSSVPLSFLGELNPDTGKIDNPQSELHGRSVAGKILVFPEARGSTVGPYVLYGAKKRDVAPLGIIVRKADAIIASSAVLAGLPCVTDVDPKNLVDGEEVTLNGTEAWVDIPAAEEIHVVTAILQNAKGEILLLKRSDKVRTFQGRWAGVSGYMEQVSPLEQAYKEIEEEVGLPPEDLTLRNEGPLVFAREGKLGFVVHSFLFRTDTDAVKLNWENTEFVWIMPSDLPRYETVQALETVWAGLSTRQRVL